jgi:hypothetical protein
MKTKKKKKRKKEKYIKNEIDLKYIKICNEIYFEIESEIESKIKI